MPEIPANKNLATEDLILISMGHSAFQYFYSGLELGIFRLLFDHSQMRSDQLKSKIKLEHQPYRCLMRGLTALKLIIKINDEYLNSILINDWFALGKEDLLLKFARFQCRIVFPGQLDLIDSFINNKNMGLQRIPGSGSDLYRRLQENKDLEKVFFDYMNSWSKETISLVQNSVDFSRCKLIADLGGGDGTNSINLALLYPNINFLILDISSVCLLADQRISENGLSGQIECRPFDLFTDRFPSGPDCFLFFHLLVIWSPEENLILLKKAYDALPADGQVVIFSSIGSDDDSGPLFSALDSAYFMATPSSGGFIYSWLDYEDWLYRAGFRSVQRLQFDSWTPHGCLTATK